MQEFTHDLITFEDALQKDLPTTRKSVSDLPLLTRMPWAKLWVQHIFHGQHLATRMEEAARVVSNAARQDKAATLRSQTESMGAQVEVVMDTRLRNLGGQEVLT